MLGNVINIFQIQELLFSIYLLNKDVFDLTTIYFSWCALVPQMPITIITDAFWSNCAKCFIYISSSYLHNDIERSYCFQSVEEKTESQKNELLP